MYERKIKLPSGKTIVFETKEDNEIGKEMIETFNKSIVDFPKNKPEDLLNNLYWRSTLENGVGNRNASYIIDTIYDNIVTPIEVEILESRAYPTDIENIIQYMCRKISEGRVDDWNDVNNLRIRTSEMIASLLQKQIHSAYNEYASKLLGGDQSAKLIINSKKVFSEFLMSQNVQLMENICPTEELSMQTRVTPVGRGGIAKSDEWPRAAMNIHHSYYGNIDPLETPESENIGILQHLTIGSSITNLRGLFSIKDRDKVNPVQILSVPPSLIPFVESNDGVRIMMASGQSKQALPLKHLENPAVQSGFESVYTPLLSDYFIKTSPVAGSVTEITKSHISIKDTNGKLHHVDVNPVTLNSGQGKNGLSEFKPVVSQGQKVIKGQSLAEGANIKDGIISNGLNVLCAFMPWKGHNFEDGMVVSESLAKKFISVHVEEQEVYLSEDQDISFIVNIGDVVRKGDIMVTYSNTLYDSETLNHLRSDGGKIVRMEIYVNVPEEDIPEILKSEYEDFKHQYILNYGKYPLGHFKEKETDPPFKGIKIRFHLEQELELRLADKLNIRFFNKGVVSTIVPDSEMPQLPNGESLQMIYNPLSIINRMNPGQLLELHTSRIARELAIRMKDQKRNDFENIMTKVISLLDGMKDKSYSKQLITGIKSLNDTDYKKAVDQVSKSRFFPLIFVPFQSPPRKNIFAVMDLLGLKTTVPLYIPEYNRTTKPVAVGYLYVNKLEHQGEKKIHSRSTGPYVSSTLTPTEGKRADGGQKLGEYDVYSLLAWDTPTVIDEFLGPISNDHKVKNEMIADIVSLGKTNYKQSTSNPVRDLLSQYMTAIHLESV